MPFRPAVRVARRAGIGVLAVTAAGAAITVAARVIAGPNSAVAWIAASLTFGLLAVIAMWTLHATGRVARAGEATRLDESDSRFRLAFSHSAIGYALVAYDGRWLRVNHALTRITGYSAQELAALTFQEITHPDDLESDLQQARLLVRGEIDWYEMEKRYIRKDGSIVPVLLTVSAIRDENGNQVCALVQVQDFEQRKRTERELTESEARFRIAVNALHEGLVVQNANGVIQLWNPAAERILGLTGDQLAGRTAYDPQWRAIDESGEPLAGDQHPSSLALRTGQGVTDRIVGVRRGDGAVAWTLVSAQPLVRPGEDAPFGVVASFTDVTAYREALAALRVSEERLKLALEGTQEGLWDWNVKTGEVYFSPRWCRMLGYEPDEVEPHVRSWEKLVHPEDMPAVMKTLTAHLEGETPFYECEHRVQAKDGRWVWILDRGKVVERDDTGAPVRAVGTHTDLTERRLLVERIHVAQKMEAVGRLAGGVAHDFNNLLTVIAASVDFLRRDMPDEHPSRADVDDIANAAARATALTRRLLAFSRQQTLKPQVMSLADLVERAAPGLRSLLRPNVTLSTRQASEPSAIRADADEISAVLEALVANANDAMPDGGEIVIETSNRWEPRDRAARHGVAEGSYVRLVVRDTGVGMDSGIVAKAFEPFFTTKRHMGATGMGLTAVYGIVSRLDGSITCESEPGSGTTFEILIPAVEPVGEATSRVLPHPSPSAYTVLVVDDEAVIRSVVQRVLTHAGYRVELAESGQSALALLAGNAERVDVMLTDVIMPGLDGNTLAQRVAAEYPHIGIAIMSGYVDDAQARATIAGTAVPFIAKPFERAALEQAVRQALDMRQTRPEPV